MRKVGVEEELLLVDPASGGLANAAGHVLHEHRNRRHGRPLADASSDIEGELLRHMLETHTDPAEQLSQVGSQLRQARRSAISASERAGYALAAVGTAPLGPAEPAVSVNPRYQRIVNEFGDTGRGAGTLGMHVHVDVDDDEEGVRVLDGLRPWLPLLTALSANSPYSSGRDTGYASWRHQVWTRWPTAGPAEPFGSVAEYRRVRQAFIDTGAALDRGMIYYEARLSATYPTVEIRVADTCTEIEDALVVVALARALVATIAASDRAGASWRSDLLRAAWWRAARYGLAGDLVHPLTATRVRAGTAMDALRQEVAGALAAAEDLDLVDEGLARLFSTGGGAPRQRAAFERTGDLGGVVADLVARTADNAG